MRLLSKKDVRARIPYSDMHIWRLCKAGKFPKPIQIGESRVAWIEAEIDDWIATKVAARDTAAGAA